MCWPDCQSKFVVKSLSACMSSPALWLLEVTEGNSTSLLLTPSPECCLMAGWWINLVRGASVVQESKMLLENSGSFLYCAGFIPSLLYDKTGMSKTLSCCRCWFAWSSAGHISGVRCCRKETDCWVLCSWEGKSILRHQHRDSTCVWQAGAPGLCIYFSFSHVAAGGWVYALLMSCAKRLCSRLICSHSSWKRVLLHSSPSENVISSYTWWIHNNFFFSFGSQNMF